MPTPLLGTTLAELALLAADEPDADTLEQLAEGTSIGAVVFDPGYVLNGDIADVVIAAQDGQLTRWTDVTVTPATAWTRPGDWPASTAAAPPIWAPIPGWPTPRRSCWPPSRSVPRAAAWT